MDSVFLGTGAGEMYPNPFCGCEVCRRARENRETRFRSAFVLDEKLMIDFGPEVCAASQHYGVPLSEIEDVLITHTHTDHLSLGTLNILTMTQMTHPIHFHFGPEALAWFENLMKVEDDLNGTLGAIASYLVSRGKITVDALSVFESHTVGGKTVTPVHGTHRGYGNPEPSSNYVIDWEKGRWMYACDTGNYEEETLSFLGDFCKGKPLDVLVSEGTGGSDGGRPGPGHLNAQSLCLQLEELLYRGIIDRRTQVYVTHINQCQSFSAAEYQRFMNLHSPVPAIIAQDGMRI